MKSLAVVDQRLIILHLAHQFGGVGGQRVEPNSVLCSTVRLGAVLYALQFRRSEHHWLMVHLTVCSTSKVYLVIVRKQSKNLHEQISDQTTV